MSVDEPHPQVLELPGQPTVRRTTGLPPRRIELPFLAYMARSRSIVLLLLGVPLLPAAWLAFPALIVHAVATFGRDPAKAFETLAMGLAYGPFLVLATESVLVARRAVFHRGYHFGFDAEKLWHFQLFEPIRFSRIKRLDVIYSGTPAAIRITTDQQLRLRFRSLRNRRKSPVQKAGTSQFTFPIGILAVDGHLLADALCHLVQARGGTVGHRSRSPVRSRSA